MKILKWVPLTAVDRKRLKTAAALISSSNLTSASSSKPQSRGSETPVSAMGEDSNHSVMSDSQDGTDFSNKINPSTAGPTPTSKVDPNAIAKNETKFAITGCPTE